MAKQRQKSDNRAVENWLREQTRRDAVIYLTVAGLMGLCGFFASIATWIFTSLVCLGFSCASLPWSLAMLLGLVVMGGLWFWHLRFDQPIERKIRIEGGPHGKKTLKITPLTGSSWLMFLDRPAEQMMPITRLVVNLLLLSPRLCTLSWRMGNLSKSCRERDFSTIAAALARLMEGGRVSIGELLDEFPEADPQRLVSELTGIEGVVLLGGNDPGEQTGLTLTSGFSDEFEQWQREHQRRKRAADY